MEPAPNALLLFGDKVGGEFGRGNVCVVAKPADLELWGRWEEEPGLRGVYNEIARAAADFGRVGEGSHEHGIRIVICDKDLAVDGVGIIADPRENIGLQSSSGRLAGLGCRSRNWLRDCSLMLLRRRGVGPGVRTEEVLDLRGKGREGPAI